MAVVDGGVGENVVGVVVATLRVVVIVWFRHLYNWCRVRVLGPLHRRHATADPIDDESRKTKEVKRGRWGEKWLSPTLPGEKERKRGGGVPNGSNSAVGRRKGADGAGLITTWEWGVGEQLWLIHVLLAPRPGNVRRATHLNIIRKRNVGRQRAKLLEVKGGANVSRDRRDNVGRAGVAPLMSQCQQLQGMGC